MKEGDIFYFKAVNDFYSCGRIITKKKHSIYVVIYKTLFNTFPSEGDVENILCDEVIIVGRTFDILFKNGSWKVLASIKGNFPSNIFPFYKIETNNGVFITDFNGDSIRKASNAEEDFYFFYNEYSPAAIVNGVKAFYGLIIMDDYYKKMTYEFVQKRTKI